MILMDKVKEESRAIQPAFTYGGVAAEAGINLQQMIQQFLISMSGELLPVPEVVEVSSPPPVQTLPVQEPATFSLQGTDYVATVDFPLSPSEVIGFPLSPSDYVASEEIVMENIFETESLNSNSGDGSPTIAEIVQYELNSMSDSDIIGFSIEEEYSSSSSDEEIDVCDEEIPDPQSPN